jgi:N-acyl-D-aspartate/D-glutamate deacylase
MKTGVLLLVLVSAISGSAQDFDLLIRGGTIVDGTGNPAFVGDLGIKDGRIAAIGRITGRTAERTIDASGLTVAPGFIDIHNHSDNTIVQDGDAQSMVRQGVTSMILGEGGSAAPSARWKDFRAYFTQLMKQGISTNIGSYVGSSEIWTFVHGEKAGPPTPGELSRMRALVREAMEQGALGVASSLSGPPGSWIDTDTLVAMCEVASKYGGIYSTHMRTEGRGVFESVAEAIEIGRRANVPVDIIHLKIAEHQMWGQMPELTATIAAARARGQDVQANVYPYRAGQNNLASIIPPWAHEGGPKAMIERLKDLSLRARLEDEINHGIAGTNWYNHYTATGAWDGMLLVSLSNPKYKQFEGKRMSDVIRTLNKPGIDVLFELLENNNGSVPTVYFHHSEDDMRYALKQPWVSIGSDGTAVTETGPLAAGNPHPRYFGTFPRVLGRYVREEKLISLEEAIRKMTSANAAKVHQYDRGLLRAGMAADVTVFNAATIVDHATYEKPHQYATGVEYVVVNGQVVLDRGKHTRARAGIILYGPGMK